MSRLSGGKNVYGASVGILMLQTRFPRVVGDIGNAQTWPFPVHYQVVPGASPDQVVRHRAEGLLPEFIKAGRELVNTGAELITSNCGFLALFQRELSSALAVPVAISSLMQVPWLQAILPAGKRVGIITISAANLSPEHLTAVGVSQDTPIAGTDANGHFARSILNDELEFDPELALAENLQAAELLLENNSDIGAIVLECTNMAPYSAAIQQRYGIPVFSLYDLICWLQSGFVPRSFSAPTPYG